MGWWSLIMLLPLFLLVTPAVQLGVEWGRRRRARLRLEKERGSRVIPLILSMETVATYGIPLLRFEQLPLTEELVAAVAEAGAGRPVDLVVDLPPDVDLDVAPLAAALAAHESPTTLLVPRRALSGGLTLAAVVDAIVLGPAAAIAGDRPGHATPTCGVADLRALGLPVEETPPEHLAGYLASFAQPQRPPGRLPFFISLPLAAPSSRQPSHADDGVVAAAVVPDDGVTRAGGRG
jgi:hypothetical protein